MKCFSYFLHNLIELGDLPPEPEIRIPIHKIWGITKEDDPEFVKDTVTKCLVFRLTDHGKNIAFYYFEGWSD